MIQRRAGLGVDLSVGDSGLVQPPRKPLDLLYASRKLLEAEGVLESCPGSVQDRVARAMLELVVISDRTPPAAVKRQFEAIFGLFDKIRVFPSSEARESRSVAAIVHRLSTSEALRLERRIRALRAAVEAELQRQPRSFR